MLGRQIQRTTIELIMKYIHNILAFCIVCYTFFSCSEYLDSIILDDDSQKVAAEGIHFPAEGGMMNLNFHANTGFSVITSTSDNKKWLKLENYPNDTFQTDTKPSAFNEPITIPITATENTDLQGREGKIIIEAPRYRKEISVKQGYKEILSLISSPTYNIPSEGDTIAIRIRANIGYAITYANPNATWIHLTDSVHTDRLTAYQYVIDALPAGTTNGRIQIIHFTNKNYLSSSPQVTIVQYPAEKKITVDKAGTLSTLINNEELQSIQKLTISGNINGDDVSFIRKVFGSTSTDATIKADFIKSLDLSKATIVKGGGYYAEYYHSGTDGKTEYVLCYTKDNTLTPWFFTFCKRLHELKLPENLLKIEDYVISNVPVEKLVIPNSVKEMKYGVAQCPQLQELTFSSSQTTLPMWAFANCPQLSKVIIPASIKSFEGSTVLGTGCALEGELHVQSYEPPTLDGELKYLYRWKLYVPKGTAPIYKKTTGWKNFKEIIEE